MAFLSDDSRPLIDNAAPGLQLLSYWTAVADEADSDARSLLSFAVSGLITRGWVSPLDATLVAAADGLDLASDRLTAAADSLQQLGLLQVKDGRIATLAGIFSTARTSTTFFMGEDQKVHLLGPLAALAASKALARPGEVFTRCSHSEPARRLRLECDESGVHSRTPDSICAFLPAWNGDSHPVGAMRGARVFADDDALAAWQEAHGDPEGMPLMSMMFPIAATELGGQLGAALASLLDRFANFE